MHRSILKRHVTLASVERRSSICRVSDEHRSSICLVSIEYLPSSDRHIGRYIDRYHVRYMIHFFIFFFTLVRDICLQFISKYVTASRESAEKFSQGNQVYWWVIGLLWPRTLNKRKGMWFGGSRCVGAKKPTADKDKNNPFQRSCAWPHAGRAWLPRFLGIIFREKEVLILFCRDGKSLPNIPVDVHINKRLLWYPRNVCYHH